MEFTRKKTTQSSWPSARLVPRVIENEIKLVGRILACILDRRGRSEGSPDRPALTYWVNNLKSLELKNDCVRFRPLIITNVVEGFVTWPGVQIVCKSKRKLDKHSFAQFIDLTLA